MVFVTVVPMLAPITIDIAGRIVRTEVLGFVKILHMTNTIIFALFFLLSMNFATISYFLPIP